MLGGRRGTGFCVDGDGRVAAVGVDEDGLWDASRRPSIRCRELVTVPGKPMCIFLHFSSSGLCAGAKSTNALRTDACWIRSTPSHHQRFTCHSPVFIFGRLDSKRLAGLFNTCPCLTPTLTLHSTPLWDVFTPSSMLDRRQGVAVFVLSRRVDLVWTGEHLNPPLPAAQS